MKDLSSTLIPQKKNLSNKYTGKLAPDHRILSSQHFICSLLTVVSLTDLFLYLLLLPDSLLSHPGLPSDHNCHIAKSHR